MNDELYDLIIIGAAAAGCTAAVYAARRQLTFAVVTKDIGGEVALSGEVENWPGTIHTTGIELAKNFEDHMKSYEPEILNYTTVTSLSQEKNIHLVHIKKGKEEKVLKTKAIIVASGIHPRELGIPGEAELRGKGITYCTVCDGPLFKGKVTATIGAGNSALESALMLAEIASKAYVITKFPDTPDTYGGFPKGESILIEKVKAHKNIEVIYSAKTSSITGDGLVTGLAYNDTETNEEKTLDVSGVMVHIGMIPNDEFIECTKKNKQREIEVNTRCETSCDGIFAAGDVTDVPFKQITIAAGQGATAALSAIDYINRWKEKSSN